MKENQLGLLIKNRRSELGLPQKEVAQKLGLKQSTYSNYENGYNQPPDKVLERLSEILEMDLLARKNELASFVDSKQEKELFLKGYQNETEQLMFFEELTSFRRALDNIKNKRVRRELSDLFSQILDEYYSLFYAAGREDQLNKSRKNLDLINQKLIKLLINFEKGT